MLENRITSVDIKFMSTNCAVLKQLQGINVSRIWRHIHTDTHRHEYIWTWIQTETGSQHLLEVPSLTHEHNETKTTPINVTAVGTPSAKGL